MQDAELRSSLRLYLESAVAQDQKLKEVLRTLASKLGPRSAFYGYICAHMEQLAARDVISETLLASLQDAVGTPSLSSERKGDTDAYSEESSLPEFDERGDSSSGALGEFEAQLVRTYNDEPEKWTRKYRPASFGASNVDDIWRSGGEPKFTKKEGGIYHLIADSGRSFVVPEPGLKLQDSYFRSEGLGQLFECPSLETEAGGRHILLVSPAIVEESGERWIVIQKGEIRERRGR